MRSIVLFGDSLTEGSFNTELDGFGAIISNLYARRADVFNRGFSGYTTRIAKYIVKDVFSSQSFRNLDLVVVLFGANDASLPELNPRQYVPLEEYLQNITFIVDHLLSLPSKPHVLLVTPPPIDADAWKLYTIAKYNVPKELPPNRSNENVKIYASSIVSLCANNSSWKGHVTCINLWTDIMHNEDWKDFFKDGLHFSSKGNIRVAQLIQETIERELPHLSPEKMERNYPDHKDIDPNALEKSFSTINH